MSEAVAACGSQPEGTVSDDCGLEGVREVDVCDVAPVNVSGAFQATGVVSEAQEVVPRHGQDHVVVCSSQCVVDDVRSRGQVKTLRPVFDVVLKLSHLNH